VSDAPGQLVPSPAESAAPAAALEALLTAVSPLAGTAYREELLGRIDACRRLVRFKLSPEATTPGQPALCVFAGGTNVGKTSLANAVSGHTLGAPSPLARATKAAVLLCHRAHEDDFLRPGFLEGYARRRLAGADEANRLADAAELLLLTHEDDTLQALAIADTPDIDSVLERNHRVAEDLLFAADAVVYVTSEEKYNDDVCVRFLERAARHGKTLLAVLNKHAAPEALEDLRGHVVPEAARDAPAGSPAPEVLAVPFSRNGGGLSGSIAPLRDRVRALSTDAPALRARAMAGARAALAAEAGPAVERLQREAALLGRYRRETDELAVDAGRGFARDVARHPVPELSRVLRLLSDALHLPVLDDVYIRARRLVAPVTGFIRQRVFGRPDPEVRAREALRERDRAELEAAERHLRSALARARELPARFPPEVADALAAALLPAAEAEALGAPGQAFQRALSEHAEAWADGLLRELHTELREHPGRFRLAKALKAAMRTAVAGTEIALTGSIGLSDALLVPVLDSVTKLGIEKAFGRVFLEQRVAAFRAERAGLVQALAEERARRVVLERLGGVEPEAVAALERALARVTDEPTAAVPGEEQP
jgi:hypothetical protein